jgi:hypothetical protein
MRRTGRSGGSALSIAAIILLIGCVAGGCGGSGGLSPDEIPDGDVAMVHETTPAMEEISSSQLRHAVAIARAQSKNPGHASRTELEKEALSSLLDQAWLMGEAEERGITVTDQEVKQEFQRLKSANFKSAKDYTSFLRRSGFTQTDVNERVKLQILSTAVQKEIADESPGHKKQAFTTFVGEYTNRWRDRTVCKPELAIERCSNGPEPKEVSGTPSHLGKGGH